MLCACWEKQMCSFQSSWREKEVECEWKWLLPVQQCRHGWQAALVAPHCVLRSSVYGLYSCLRKLQYLIKMKPKLHVYRIGKVKHGMQSRERGEISPAARNAHWKCHQAAG